MNPNDWKIAHEGNCWTVYERKVAGAESKEPGTVSWAGRSFHATPEQAALSLFNRLLAAHLGEAELTRNVETVLQVIRSAQAQVSTVVEATFSLV